MKNKSNEIEMIEENKSNLAEKEEEIIESYEDKVYEYEEYEEEEINQQHRKVRKTKRRINIFFGIIVLIMIMVAVDIIAVAKFDVGPFFSIPLHTYKDGGSKEYYGLGYKVIKYHQIQGRRDRELGSWSLKYNADPVTAQDVDLAIEFSDNEAKTYEKYYKKFVRIISTLQKVDEKNHSITIGYKDEGKKYSLTIKCDIVKEQTNINKFEVGKPITIIGTVKDFKGKTDKQVNRLYIKNCFAEQ